MLEHFTNNRLTNRSTNLSIYQLRGKGHVTPLARGIPELYFYIRKIPVFEILEIWKLLAIFMLKIVFREILS
jgi:hypothetical protein